MTVTFPTFLFYLFALVLIYAAVRTITARNPVVAVLHLVLAFFNAAGLWLLLKAEFLAIALVLVYVGAVMVLFLFVVMMLDINLDRIRQGFWRNLPAALVVGLIIVAELSVVLIKHFPDRESDVPRLLAGQSNTKLIGSLLYTDYAYAFEIAAVVLLVAIIAAVALTLRARKDVKYNDPSAAVKVRREDRVRLVKMPSAAVRSAGGSAAAPNGSQGDAPAGGAAPPAAAPGRT
jgi:NADH-quinone oxidoreductase subunit J